MTRNDYISEIERFKTVLTALDCTHRLKGNIYTPAEIQAARKALKILEQLIEVGLYDFKKQRERC
jgi:hypothetical protein